VGNVTRGQLTLEAVPFATQDGFDRMLWDCDLNLVRGEDSFVRAQWAARPFVWQPYGQADEAHLVKLRAFLDRYGHGVAQSAETPLRAFWQAVNDEDGEASAAAWPAFRDAIPALEAHGRAWSRSLCQLPDLATGWDGVLPHRPALVRHAQAWAQTLASGPELGASLVEFARERL
jgi:uncharacterized repeat protein (TIGR03837 family)